MGTTMGLSEWLRDVLGDLATQHGVPGAAVAVIQDGRRSEAAPGVINVETEIETTADTLFQVGSITKPVTATLVMQLVEDGLLDLDTPLTAMLPELRLASDTPDITLRHVL